MKRLALVLSTSLFVGCTGFLPSSQTRGASIVLSPQIQDGRYHTQATVSVYTSTSIHHLVVKLFQGSTELASKTLSQANLNQPITFSNLRNNTAYRIKSYAYLADETLISQDSSYLDITTQTDDRPSIGALPVFLTDIPFNAIGSSSIQVTNGGYRFDGPESMAVQFLGVVSAFAGVVGATGSVDGAATTALFSMPTGLAVQGNALYVSDSRNYTIRKILLSSGEVSTFAGTAGLPGSTDAFGATARFQSISSLVADGGNLYAADSGNHTIRKIVLATGEVTTIAGSPGATGSVDGIGSAARFFQPYGVAVEGPDLYVTEVDNHAIRKVSLATGEVSTLAGTKGFSGATDGIGTTAQFNKPRRIVSDGRYLYVADDFNYAIRQISLATGEVTTLAGALGVLGSANGAATDARFRHPYGLALNGPFLYVTDRTNDSLRCINLDTKMVTTLASGFSGPHGLATDGNYLYLSDSNDSVIRKIR